MQATRAQHVPGHADGLVRTGDALLRRVGKVLPWLPGPRGEVISDRTRDIVVDCDAAEAFARWSDPESVARVADRYVQVTVTGPDRTRWQLTGPAGQAGHQAVEWELRLTEKHPPTLVRWESAPGATVHGELTARMTPTRHGVQVSVRHRLRSADRDLRSAARLLALQSPRLVSRMVWRFKSLAETGELPTLRDNPSARVPVDNRHGQG